MFRDQEVQELKLREDLSSVSSRLWAGAVLSLGPFHRHLSTALGFVIWAGGSSWAGRAAAGLGLVVLHKDYSQRHQLATCPWTKSWQLLVSCSHC